MALDGVNGKYMHLKTLGLWMSPWPGADKWGEISYSCSR